MSDIVERLHLSANPECWEAADEIERLRAALQEIANSDGETAVGIARRALETKP